MGPAGFAVRCDRNPDVLILGSRAAPSDARLACNARIIGLLPGGHRALLEADLLPKGFQVASFMLVDGDVVAVPAPLHIYCETVSISDERYVELLAEALLAMYDCVAFGKCYAGMHPAKRCLRCGIGQER